MAASTSRDRWSAAKARWSTVLEAKCKLIDARAQRVVLMLGYSDVYEAADHITDILPFNPTALEGSDYRMFLSIQKKGGPHAQALKLMPDGKGWLMAEFGADKREDALDVALSRHDTAARASPARPR